MTTDVFWRINSPNAANVFGPGGRWLAWTAFGMLATINWLNSAAAQQPAAKSTIAYRLVDSKTLHFDDPQKAADHLQAVQKLGCDVAKADHAGHGDVSYRCTKWKALTVENDKLAHQWQEWLTAASFETLHGHPEEGDEHGGAHDHEHAHEGERHEEVTYQLPNWVTLHPQQEDEAKELVAIFQGLGCELREARREGRIDISIRCTEWMHLDVSSHEAAEFWQQYLTKTGFEAKHEDEHESIKTAR